MRRIVPVLLLLFSALLPAQELEISEAGEVLGHTYAAVEADLTVRFEWVPTPGFGSAIAEVTFADGTWTVFAGPVALGGLNIPFVMLYPALEPFAMLRNPMKLLTDGLYQQHVDPSTQCQVILWEFPAGEVTFNCVGGPGFGRLVRLR